MEHYAMRIKRVLLSYAKTFRLASDAFSAQTAPPFEHLFLLLFFFDELESERRERGKIEFQERSSKSSVILFEHFTPRAIAIKA
jgi:hypothetical protein